MFSSKRSLLVLTTAASIAVLSACSTAVPVPEASPAAAVSSSVAGAGETTDDLHPVAQEWLAAWLTDDPARMGAMMTPDGVYEDFSSEVAWTGPEQVAQWVTMTHEGIADVGGTITDSFHVDDRIAIVWSFSGQLRGAPQPFSVTATTIIQLDGDRVARISDYYSLATLLRQSGLPADTTFGS